MADLVAIGAQAASNAFTEVFDPRGEKRTRAALAEEKRGRLAQLHEQDLDLKEQQIKQARIKTALEQDALKAQRLGQKFVQTNQDPRVAAEMYNSMEFGDEMKFDESHLQSTMNGGRPDKPGMSTPGEPQTTGEFKFLRGHYKYNEKGEKVKGEDGKPIFVETGEPVIFKTKQEMVDAVTGVTLDPKLRTAKLLSEYGFDEFLKKEDVKRETKGIEAEMEKEQIELRGSVQKEVAQIYADAKLESAEGKAKGKGLTATQSDSKAKDFRKVLRENLVKRLNIDEDEIPNWQLPEIKKIQAFETHKSYKEAYERLLKLPPHTQNKALAELQQRFDFPDSYKKVIKQLLLRDTEEK